MKLHRLEIKNFKSVDHLLLDDLDTTGVVVVSGPNEHGKSTVMEAFGLLLAAEKWNSRKQYITAFHPDGDASRHPWITAEMTFGDTRFTVTEEFAAGSAGSMTLEFADPSEPTLTGDRALSRFRDLKRDHIDDNLLAALFVGQGELTNDVQAASISTLTTVLSNAGGAEMTGADQSLVDAAEKEMLKYVTAKKREDTKELKTLAAAIADAEATITTCRAKVADFEATRQALDAAGLAIDKAAGRADELEAKRVEAKKRHTAAVERRDKLAAAKEKVTLAEEAVTRAGKDIADHRARTAEVEQAREELTALDAILPGLRDKAVAEQRQREELAAQEKKATADKQRQRAIVAAITEAAAREARTRRRAELHGVITRLDEQLTMIGTLTKSLEANPVTGEVERRGLLLKTEVDKARYLVDAVSPRIDFTAATPTTVSIDGEEITVDRDAVSRTVTDTITAVIGDVTATVVPGHSDDGARDRLRRAEEELREFLDSCGAGDIDEVTQKAASHRATAQELARAEQQFATILAGRDEAALRREYDHLTDTADDTGKDSPRDDPECPDFYRGMDSDELADRQRRAGEKLDEAEDTIETIRRELERLRSDGQAMELTTKEAEHVAAVNTLARADKALAALASREELDDRLTDAQAVLAKATAAFGQLADDGSRPDAEAAGKQLTQATAAVAANAQALSRAEKDRARALGALESLDGTTEKLDRAVQAKRALEIEQAGIMRRRDAACLLFDTLNAHFSAARASYLKPYTTALETLAATVFGRGTTITVDPETLAIDKRSLSSGQSLDVGVLSGGAKEQLALINRFAIAELVGRGGTAMPVFIDDALGFSDQQRTQAVNGLLDAVGETTQVFVFTCEASRYMYLTDADVRHIDEMKIPATD
ncbi:AAA family ATPase [Corynebacterium mendelii]|uniref:AAA family ATPase n=1 Tax=Corynebacterium mendelii TaxID=2765362 RepID=A0A939E3I1_9CORY|nr:AAA family ATPase [Corynebacterium mendelii]MBN9644907.1 AAA family ATPase [Corynebacterium mendelii]